MDHVDCFTIACFNGVKNNEQQKNVFIIRVFFMRLFISMNLLLTVFVAVANDEGWNLIHENEPREPDHKIVQRSLESAQRTQAMNEDFLLFEQKSLAHEVASRKIAFLNMFGGSVLTTAYGWGFFKNVRPFHWRAIPYAGVGTLGVLFMYFWGGIARYDHRNVKERQNTIERWKRDIENDKVYTERLRRRYQKLRPDNPR